MVEKHNQSDGQITGSCEWCKDKSLFEYRLEQCEKRLTKTGDQVAKNTTDILINTMKSGAWGTLGGAISVAVALLVNWLSKGGG